MIIQKKIKNKYINVNKIELFMNIKIIHYLDIQ